MKKRIFEISIETEHSYKFSISLLALIIGIMGGATRSYAACTTTLNFGFNFTNCSGASSPGIVNSPGGNDTVTNTAGGSFTGRVSFSAGGNSLENSGTMISGSSAPVLEVLSSVNNYSVRNNVTGVIRISDSSASNGAINLNQLSFVNNQIINSGLIENNAGTGNAHAIYLTNSAGIENNGTIRGSNGTIRSVGSFRLTNNNGALIEDTVGGNGAIYIQEAGFRIENTGTITTAGSNAITLTGTTGNNSSRAIINNATGIINGNLNFSGFIKTGSSSFILYINRGVINGDLLAGVNSRDILTFNGGNITGNVNLGDNDDTADINANFSKSIVFGTGNDTLDIASAITLTGNQDLGTGNDVVTSRGTLDGNIIFSDGNDRYTSNTGAAVTGDINFGNNNDSFIFNGGTISGTVDLGTGNDTADINSDLTKVLTYDAGNDILNVATGATLTGNQDTSTDSDTATIRGTLDGNLNLGANNDIFVIDLNAIGTVTGTNDGGAGTDIIRLDSTSNSGTYAGDLETNYETLNFTGGNTSTFDNDSLNTINSATITGSGTVAEIGTGTTLTLTGTFSDDANDNTINIAGILNGNINFSGGTDTLNLNGGSITGDIIDSNVTVGTSTVVVNSNFTTGGDITASRLSITPAAAPLMSGSPLNSGGPLALFSPSGTTFTINSGNTVSLNSMSGGIGAGVLQFQIDAAGSVGALNVTGAGEGINLTGLSLDALVDPAAAITFGDEIQLGTGNAQVTGMTGALGQATTQISDDSLLFDFSVADGGQADITTLSADNTDLFLLVQQVSTHALSAITSNAINAGSTLDQLSGSTDPQITEILSQTGQASTRESLEGILQTTLPSVDRGSITAVQKATNGTQRIVTDRLTILRDNTDLNTQNTGIASGDSGSKVQSWGQTFAQQLEQDYRDEVAGFQASIGGFTLAADTQAFSSQSVMGAAFTYARIDVNSDNATNTQTDIDAFTVSLYGDYDLGDTVYLVGNVAYTYGDNESIRYNVGGINGLEATSDYGSHQIESRVVLADHRYLEEWGGLDITPKAQLHYIHFQNEDIEETGAGGANLSTDSKALDILEIGIGADIRKDFELKDGKHLSPQFSIGYRFDVLGEAVQTTSTFAAGGPSFVSEGAEPAQSTLNLGVGLGFAKEDNWELTASYNYESKSDFNAHSGLLRAAYQLGSMPDREMTMQQMPFSNPSFDLDGDGVFDPFDLCSNTPKHVSVSSDGCPQDSDNDGVADFLDSCPKTLADTKVNMIGCSRTAVRIKSF